MKGVPARLEIGPKDIENNQVTIFRRDTLEKTQIPMENLKENIENLLDDIHDGLYNKALKLREEKTYVAKDMDEFKKTIEETPGFIKAMWCGDTECELKVKEETGATIRCMPFEQENLGDTCVCCGKKAEKMAYFAKAY